MREEVNGFSLIELMTVISIIGLLSMMSMVGFKFFLQKSESEIMSSQLLGAIHLTRSESVLRHEKIILCGSQDQENCANNWEGGYIIRSMNQVIYHFQMNAEKGMLYWRSFPLDRAQLEFVATGFPNSQNGTFWFCGAGEKNPSWSIVVNKTGRARISYPDKNGEVCDDKGIRLIC